MAVPKTSTGAIRSSSSTGGTTSRTIDLRFWDTAHHATGERTIARDWQKSSDFCRWRSIESTYPEGCDRFERSNRDGKRRRARFARGASSPLSRGIDHETAALLTAHLRRWIIPLSDRGIDLRKKQSFTVIRISADPSEADILIRTHIHVLLNGSSGAHG